MAGRKWVIVVVDGTAATGPYWRTILSGYLEKIFRYILLQSKRKMPSAIVEFGLVIYKAHTQNADFVVRPSPWTRDVYTFQEWLSALQFNGGGFGESAIAEGLAEALVMFPKRNQAEEEQFPVERHCILVASSNPFVLPKPVALPTIKDGQFSAALTQLTLSTVDQVAKKFYECSVYLSIISPKKLPKLREIYSLANNTSGALPLVQDVKNPQFMILLSHKFPQLLIPLIVKETASSLMPIKFAWDGGIYGWYNGQYQFIGAAWAQIKLSAPASLTADWPFIIDMDETVLPLQVFWKYRPKLPRYCHVLIVVRDDHLLCRQLIRLNCCALIKLPSQTLVIYPKKKVTFHPGAPKKLLIPFVGYLYPGQDAFSMLKHGPFSSHLNEDKATSAPRDLTVSRR